MFSPVVSGYSNKKNTSKPDKDPDTATRLRPILTRRQYQIFYYLIKQQMACATIAKRLKISRQTVNEHIKNLEILGVIKPINKDANPKFYKATLVVPSTSFAEGRTARLTINKHAKTPERRVGKPLKAVRDHTTGRFKGKREGRGLGHKRDYDTIISQNGQRLAVFRLNALSYTCKIVNPPQRDVPWTRTNGPNGMDQWVLRYTVSNKKTDLEQLRNVEVTFVRQKTANSDQLIIYMPELYLLSYELVQAEKVLEEDIWKARKWFQSTYKTYLSMPTEYRSREIAREEMDPRMREVVQEHGMLKIQTKRGYAMVDESKKGYPEREYTTKEQAFADLNSADRLLDLEASMAFLMEQQKKTAAMLEEMAHKQSEFLESQKHFTEEVQEFIGLRRKMDKNMKRDSEKMYG